MFGTTVPGDEKHIYDHDFWGNISYGYTMKAAGFKDWETKSGAKFDDYWQSGLKGYDSKDEPSFGSFIIN